jgi:hypothetical protein
VENRAEHDPEWGEAGQRLVREYARSGDYDRRFCMPAQRVKNGAYVRTPALRGYKNPGKPRVIVGFEAVA